MKHLLVAPSDKYNRLTRIIYDEALNIPTVAFPKGGGSFYGLAVRYPKSFWYALKAIRIFSTDYDIKGIVVRDDPMLALAAQAMASRLKIKWLYQISHLKEEENLDTFFEQTGGIKNLALGSVGRFLRNRLLTRSNGVFVISNQMKKTLWEQGIRRTDIVVVPEGVGESLADLGEAERMSVKSRVREELNIGQDVKVFVYLGTLNPYRKHDVMIKGFEKAVRAGAPIHLLIIGGAKNDVEKRFLDDIRDNPHISDKVTITGLIPHEEVNRYLLAADVGLSLFRPTRVLINNSPVKFFEYLNACIPVIATRIPEQESVITKYHCGWLCEFDENDISRTIQMVTQLPETEIVTAGVKGQEFVATYRTFANISKAVIDTYHEIGLAAKRSK